MIPSVLPCRKCLPASALKFTKLLVREGFFGAPSGTLPKLNHPTVLQ